MNVLIHATGSFPEVQFLAAEWQGVHVHAIGEIQGFSSHLFRDSEAIGLLFCDFPDLAPQIVRGMRDGNITSRLIVLLRERGAEAYRSGVRARTLMAGADDAQPDNIDPVELVARLRALNVRTRSPVDLIALTQNATLDPSNQKVSCAGNLIHLTKNEAALLELLVSRRGTCVSKSFCMQALYGGRDEPQTKIIDVFLCKLRRKLKPIWGDADPIHTVWGKGYRFEAHQA